MNNFIQQTDKALKKKKKRWTTKGRQVEDKYLNEVQDLLKDTFEDSRYTSVLYGNGAGHFIKSKYSYQLNKIVQ